MCSIPGGGRGPSNAYSNHKNAILKSNKYDLFELSQFSRIEELSHMDIFWFSVRFHPQVYYALKNMYPNKVFVMGPNVLFEKAEIGPSDEWEKWFIQNVESDFYFNKADFYLERAKQFYKGSKQYEVLRNCIDLKSYSSPKKEKDIDVLLYYKNRRIDNQLDKLFPEFLSMIEGSGLRYKILSYGDYNRESYFSLLQRSHLCVWFSIEDFCSNAQLEAQYFNVPVLGTKYNLTDTFDKTLRVDAATISSDEWIKWKEEMPHLYMDKVHYFFEHTAPSIKNLPSDFIKQNFSYKAYEKQLNRIFS